MLWEKPYKWKKYTLNQRERLGYFNSRPSEEFLIDRFTRFYDFRVRETAFGTFEVTAIRHITEENNVGVVTSPNKNKYPHDGIQDGYYYKLIE